MTKLFIGIVSSTSINSVDAVLVDLATSKPKIIAVYKEAWPKSLQRKLHRLFGNESFNLSEFAALDIACGKVFAEVVNNLLEKSKTAKSKIIAIGCHGQTVFHNPCADSPATVQIGDPNTVAALTGIKVVADFRRTDVALGGQGAPLNAAFHEHMFRDGKNNTVLINISGISYATVIPKAKTGKVLGFCTGPGNTLLDALARQYLKKSFDKDGKWASGGKVNDKLLQGLLDDYYFHRIPPKSASREYFNLRWVKQKMRVAHVSKIKPQDLAATLLELTARSIADVALKYAKKKPRLIISDGGVYGEIIFHRITELVKPLSVSLLQDFAIEPDHLAPMAIAWMAENTLDGKPSNIPSVTGAFAPAVLGAIYLGILK